MRLCVYIDGFNLYHRIAGLPQISAPDKSLRWLNLYALAEKLCCQCGGQLETVYYFSALAGWKPAAVLRHKTYIAALRFSGVKVKLGKFKAKSAKCPNCLYKWKKHEEKESDVNLALQAVADAYEDKYDRAYIISEDSDMIPAMQMVKEKFPQKEICAAFAPAFPGMRKDKRAIDIKNISDSFTVITLEQIAACSFPMEVRDEQGRLIARRPKEWR